MQEIRSSNPPVVTGICDPNKSRARHHRKNYSTFNNNCCHQIQATERVGDTNSVQANLKGADDVMILRSGNFDKISLFIKSG